MGGPNILFPVPMRTLPTRLKTPVTPWRSRPKGIPSGVVGLSTYEGSKPITLESDFGPVSDNLADKKTQMLFALGPGFDLLSNQIDRFYLNLYGGYAVVDYEYDVCDDVLRDSRDENLNGFWGMARLGYEHQFGRSFSLGGFLQGAYVGEEFNWGIGLRIGFRTSDFRWKKPSASY